MWDLIRLTKYKGYVATVVEIGVEKKSYFMNRDYFKNRFLPKFGFSIKMCEQVGNKIYFVGQTG